MVKVAVAGGTGNVATEILRAPIASGKHDITIFTRSAPREVQSGVSYKKVDYQDRASLTEALKGFDVCLSFLVVHQDEGCVVQKNLIHACIDAGVRRFAPSEWGMYVPFLLPIYFLPRPSRQPSFFPMVQGLTPDSKNGSGVPPYANKDAIADYLAELNRNETVLEYTLFQPSIFMDYFAHPNPLSPNLITWPFFLDFENRRAMILDTGDQPIVLTAIADISSVLSLALEDPSPWPTVGGMRGSRTTINELVALGKKLRGGEWQIEQIKGEDVEKGELKSSWVPQMSHPVIPVADRAQFSMDFVIMFFEGILRGSWDVSDEFNKRYPDFKFIAPEEYLGKAWDGKA